MLVQRSELRGHLPPHLLQTPGGGFREHGVHHGIHRSHLMYLKETLQVQKYPYVVELSTQAFKMWTQATKAAVIFTFYALTGPDICLLET